MSKSRNFPDSSCLKTKNSLSSADAPFFALTFINGTYSAAPSLNSML